MLSRQTVKIDLTDEEALPDLLMPFSSSEVETEPDMDMVMVMVTVTQDTGMITGMVMAMAENEENLICHLKFFSFFNYSSRRLL